MADRASVSHITDDTELLGAIEQALCGGGEEQFDVHVTHPDVARRVAAGVREWLEKGVAVGCTAATSGAPVSPVQTTGHAGDRVSPVTDDMVARGAHAIECLLQMLGVPDGQPADGYRDEPYARTVSRAVLRAALAEHAAAEEVIVP